jgi:hypothetical protein
LEAAHTVDTLADDKKSIWTKLRKLRGLYGSFRTLAEAANDNGPAAPPSYPSWKRGALYEFRQTYKRESTVLEKMREAFRTTEFEYKKAEKLKLLEEAAGTSYGPRYQRFSELAAPYARAKFALESQQLTVDYYSERIAELKKEGVPDIGQFRDRDK